MSATDRPGRLTVQDALAEPVLQRGLPEVMTGADSLDRPVRWVHITAFADIASVLRGGELLLSTGMGIPTAAAEQRGWIGALDDRGVAALVIELGSTLREVPAELRRAAAERELPLIVLKRQIPFVAVTEALHPRITGVEVEELRAAQRIRERLTRVVLEGAGAADLLLALEEALGGPAWVSRASGETVHGTPSATEAATRAPVRLGSDEQWATLFVAAPPSVAPAVVRAAADEAAVLIALLLRRADERDALSLSHAGAFLRDLMAAGRSDDELDLRERANGLGMSLAPDWLVPLVALAPGRPEWTTTIPRAKRKLVALGVPLIAGVTTGSSALLGVYEVRDQGDRERSAEALAAVLGEGVTLCVGAAASSWTALRGNLRATLEAAPAAALRAPGGWQDVAIPGAEDLLYALRDEPVARAFVQQRLGPLIRADERRHSHLFPTLETYCLCGGHKADTARALELERQSLYKRLRRIEDILGVDLEDPHTRLELHVAVLALRFYERVDASGGATIASWFHSRATGARSLPELPA